MELINKFFNHDAQAGGFYPKSHTGLEIKEFVSSQNILIEGIRGTGKTHILKMIEKHCLDTFDQNRILPVFVSLAQINEHARKNPDEFRLHLHTHIVRRCIETVETHKTHLQSNEGAISRALKTISLLFGFTKQPDEFDKIIFRIKEISEYLMYKLQFDLTADNFKEHSAEKFESKKKGSLQTEYKLPIGLSVKGSGEISNSASIESISEETLMFVGSRLAHHDSSGFIIEFFRQIHLLLNLDHILLLLDECSEASFSAQVEIFRLFKAIRGARSANPKQDNLAFFIGGVYPHGETYYPNRIQDGFSFDPGQDCTMQFLQLDEIDLETYVNFFQEMTYLRAQEIIFYKGNFHELQELLFENRNTFLLATFCANGIPRRFWQILKLAYDPSIKKIMFHGVDNAIHEIVNNQILTLGNLSEKDLDFMEYVIDILSNKNVDIRKKCVGVNKLPQNIYFSLNRKISKFISSLVMQGAIHNKSRMRTKRRRSVQPMYSIDIAIAFTFRVIPPKTLVSVINTDIPKCANNNFDLAPEIKPKGIANIYDDIDESDLFDPTNDGFPEGTGIIKSYNEGKFGYINSADEGSDIFFWSNQVPEIYRKFLKSGDQVKFFIKESKQGRQAIQIEIIASNVEPNVEQEIAVAQIISYVPGKFGFVKLFDGSPNAFFHSSVLDDSLKEVLKCGDKIACKFSVNERGLYCYDIRTIK